MSGTIRLNGSSSGYVELTAPAVAGSTSLELPLDSLQPGLVHLHTEIVSSATTSASIDSVFTSEYQDYRVVSSLLGSGGSSFQLRMRASGTDQTSNLYSWRDLRITTAPSLVGDADGSATWVEATPIRSTYYITQWIEIGSPKKAWSTSFSITGADSNESKHTTALLKDSTSYDGLTLFTNSAATFTGTIRIYGYRNN